MIFTEPEIKAAKAWIKNPNSWRLGANPALRSELTHIVQDCQRRAAVYPDDRYWFTVCDGFLLGYALTTIKQQELQQENRE